MTCMLFASLGQYIFGWLLFLTSLFLILLVLVQRGRGGGLTGALGGMGGQSAFGAKAGDVFTRITMITATIWILLGIASIKFLATPKTWGPDNADGASMGNPLAPGDAEDASEATDDATNPATDAGNGDSDTTGLDESTSGLGAEPAGTPAADQNADSGSGPADSDAADAPATDAEPESN